MPRPPLCVVMPNYDHGHYLAQAVGAILPQLTADDLLLVVDDASTDDSVAVYERTVGSDPRARLLRNPTNRGVIHAMNLGLGEARQPYVYFAAADDEVAPGFVGRSLALLAAHPDAALSVAMTRTMDAEGRDTGRLPTGLLTRRPAYVPPEAVRRALLRDDTWLSGNATVYRREPLVAAGGFRQELGSFTDGFTSRLLACRHGVCFIPEDLCHWRRLPTAYSHVGTIDRSRRTAVMDEALRLMTTTYRDDFPAGYAQRWAGRWEFGARAAELRAEGRAPGMLRPFALAALFLRLRPADAWWMARRRLHAAMRPGVSARGV